MPEIGIRRESWWSQSNRWYEPKSVYPQEWSPRSQISRLHLVLSRKAHSAASREPRARDPALRDRIGASGYRRHYSLRRRSYLKADAGLGATHEFTLDETSILQFQRIRVDSNAILNAKITPQICLTFITSSPVYLLCYVALKSGQLGSTDPHKFFLCLLHTLLDRRTQCSCDR